MAGFGIEGTSGSVGGRSAPLIRLLRGLIRLLSALFGLLGVGILSKSKSYPRRSVTTADPESPNMRVI